MNTAALQQLPLWEDAANLSGARGAVEGHWRVRRSRRAQRLGVQVFRDGSVEIVVPMRVGAHQVERFVARHRQWIERHSRKIPSVDANFPPTLIELRALNEIWHCQVAADSRPVFEIRTGGSAGGTLQLGRAAESAAQQMALLDWLAERASVMLAPQLVALAARHGVPLRRVQIRRQRTRWGSCSIRGTVSLNACLLFHRPAVVQYLFAHELAHLTHMNHSPRFWDLVAQYEPEWRELDRELTRGWSQVPGWLLAALRA